MPRASSFPICIRLPPNRECHRRRQRPPGRSCAREEVRRIRGLRAVSVLVADEAAPECDLTNNRASPRVVRTKALECARERVEREYAAPRRHAARTSAAGWPGTPARREKVAAVTRFERLEWRPHGQTEREQAKGFWRNEPDSVAVEGFEKIRNRHGSPARESYHRRCGLAARRIKN